MAVPKKNPDELRERAVRLYLDVLLDVIATVDHPQWLEAVYSDRTLATELTGVPANGAPGMRPQVTPKVVGNNGN